MRIDGRELACGLVGMFDGMTFEVEKCLEDERDLLRWKSLLAAAQCFSEVNDAYLGGRVFLR